LRAGRGGTLPRQKWCSEYCQNRKLDREIGQQPVKQFRQKSANVLELPDFIGCLQFFASCLNRANRLQIT
jgi:hypothetical protein